MQKDFYDYIIYDDGRVYSKLRKIFLKGEIVQGYLQYTLAINRKPVRYKAHRLVGYLFLSNPHNYPFINHIDGNKLNNHVSNLEWCTAYYNNKHARDTGLNNISKANSERWNNQEFREKTSKRLSEAITKSGCVKGERNPRFRYRIFKGTQILDRQELSKFLNISQSYCDTLIRKSANGQNVNLFIDNDIKIIDIYK